MILIKKYMSTFCYLLLALFFLVGSSFGIVFESDENIHISNLHKLEDDLFAAGTNITIDGLVEGDLFACGHTINTNGHIKGSQNIFGYKFYHTGKVDGALRTFTNISQVDGYVGRSLMIFGNDITVSKKAVIEKDAVIGGNTIRFDGTLKGNAHITGYSINISGVINGDVTIEAEKMKILPPAIIKGNLTYTSKNEDDIVISSGVTIIGETKWKLLESEDYDKEDSTFTAVILEISKFFAAFLFGVILLFITKKYILETVNQLRNRFTVAAATGFLSLIIFILSLLVLVISSFFILIGLVLISGDLALVGALVLALSILMVPITSFATVSGGILFYSGKIAIALLLGFLIIKLIKPKAEYLSRFQLFTGLVILTLLFSLPYLGFLLYLLISIIGAGGIILGIKHCQRESSKTEERILPSDSSPTEQPTP